MQIAYRVTLRRTTCTEATINIGTIGVSPLNCRKGCIGSIGGSTLNCTDLMISDVSYWSSGEQTYTHTFRGTESYFEAS